MRKLLLFALLLLTTSFCFAQDRVQILASAIAKAEGFGKAGAIPSRYKNPGDLKAVRGYRYPGQVGVGKGGHVIFRSNAAGWNALEHQLYKIIEGTSRHYTVNMTLRQLGKRYAGSSVWAKNVARTLRVGLDAQLWEILDVAPVLEGVQCPSLNAASPVASILVLISTRAGSTASSTGKKPWGNHLWTTEHPL